MWDKAREQIESIGLVVERLETQPNPRNAAGVWRVPTQTDKGAKRSGWYVLREYTTRDGELLLYGKAGNWKTDATVEIEPDGVKLSPGDKQALEKQRKAAREAANCERKARASEAAKRAARIWPKLPSEGTSPYLERKGVGGYGVRYARGAVVVPLWRDQSLVGLQWIAADGSKRFLTGTEKQGACHQIGELSDNTPILIAEGYATGASLYQATGYPVLVVFDAGNIEPVLSRLRADVPMGTLVVCADDDHESAGNVGQAKAVDAAERHGARVISPLFQDASGKSDFNDMHAEQGLPAVRQHVLAELDRQSPLGDDPSNWQEQLVTNRDGKPTVTLHNVATIMENDARLAGLLHMNSFATRVEMAREPPFGGDKREVSDAEIAELAAWFGSPETYSLNVSTGMMHEAVTMVAARNAFHPVRAYLDGLEWDGIERLPTMFKQYFGVPYDEYSSQVALNFMISAVARVRDPGCKCDLMLILEGHQGAGKSQSIKILCGRDWFAEALEPPESKDFYQILQGRWILEIAEMQSFSKAQVSRIKAALSTDVDVYRPSYGRIPRAYPRQSVFVGTTNDDEYLRDPTGARRFMPVRVGSVELEDLEADRDQLWAEADVRWRRGECYWELPAQADFEREKRFTQDSWTDPIMDWLDGRGHHDNTPAAFSGPVNEVTIDEVLTNALNLDKSRHSRQEQMRVGAVMKRLGWTKRQRRRNGRVRWMYVRPDEDQPEQADEAVDAF